MQINRMVTLMLFFLTSIQGFSQSKVNLNGIVLSDNSKPVEGVSVALKGTTYSALTDEKGEYEITAEPGNYILLFSYVGFKPKQVKIILGQSDKTIPTIFIEEDMAALDEVQVKGKSKVQRVKEQAYNITAVNLKKLYNSSADLNQVLNRTTGVRVRETGGMGSEFKFYLNGFTGDQVKFYMDGIPMDNYGSSFTLNNIPTTMAERIDVYKGVVPIELGGDAIGGAVNIVTNKTARRFIDASYSFGSFNTHKAALNTRFTTKNGIMTNLNAFVNYSDNNYKVDASIPDPFSGVFGPKQEVEHFHDQYKQATIMAEVGVRDKKYADYLLIGAAVSANRNEIQQGVTMINVVGDAFTDSKNFVPSLKYKKSNLFVKNLTATLAASYNIMQERVIDTSSARYDWSGNYVIKSYESGGEINVNKLLTVLDIKSLQSNANLKYDLNENNAFGLNYSYLGYKRTQYDEYDEDVELIKPRLDKNFLGFSYNLTALQKRLSYVAFAKMYNLKGEVMGDGDFYGEREKINISFNDWGYGTVAAYFIIPEELQIKASYEHAYRLPSAVELLGDGGSRIIPNPNLKPETSDNININISYNNFFDKHSFGIDGGFIYRNSKDWIQIGRGLTKVPYENFKKVEITGFEGVVRYGYKKWFTFDANVTYQQTLNKDDTLVPNTNQVNYFYNKQMGNTPILWGNSDLGFHFKNIKYTDDNFTVNLSGSYSDSYYLNPPSLGGENKREIPEQLYYSAAMSYSWQNGRYNAVLECNNITDENLYDYFNVQKPGRSFTLKLRYFFM
ncbi:TonB-dependent receptor [Flavobacterium piscis]|uniref:Outer membrane cobalamin receptor n=1 Tax=Flavobacterium piscis TaxID=1114874 RepID=A0ABU1Y1T8_9FLAO|nr:TonB-dependent receptor [Flavobacterium piscis]MDR7208192.1 outer membrane cobalamin receptor [Flavobacterium piscis]